MSERRDAKWAEEMVRGGNHVVNCETGTEYALHSLRLPEGRYRFASQQPDIKAEAVKKEVEGLCMGWSKLHEVVLARLRALEEIQKDLKCALEDSAPTAARGEVLRRLGIKAF